MGHIGTVLLMSFDIDFDSGSWAPTIYMYEMDHVEIKHKSRLFLLGTPMPLIKWMVRI